MTAPQGTPASRQSTSAASRAAKNWHGRQQWHDRQPLAPSPETISRRNKQRRQRQTQLHCQIRPDGPAAQPTAIPACITANRKASENVLMQAIRSLYKDRLEPLDHHVRRRIEEQTGVRWSPEALMSVAGPAYNIEIEEEPFKCKRWLYLLGEVGDFVNQTAPNDTYPKELWEELRSFVDSHAALWVQAPQVTSRYDVAHLLHQHVSGLQAYTLGEACHIVQLAIQTHHILGYRSGRVVPYEESLDHEKRANANRRQATGTSGTERVISDWPTAQRILSEMLNDREYASGLELSALKVAIRTRFACNLNETVLGHTKLSTLIGDPHFTKICRVEARGSEILLFRAAQSAWQCEGKMRARKTKGKSSGWMTTEPQETGNKNPPKLDLAAATWVEGKTTPPAYTSAQGKAVSPPAEHGYNLDPSAFHGATFAMQSPAGWAAPAPGYQLSAPMPYFHPVAATQHLQSLGFTLPMCPPFPFPKEARTEDASGNDVATSHIEPKVGCSANVGRFEDAVVYEPVISWKAHVVRTFIEFRNPQKLRREKSCPGRLMRGDSSDSLSSRPPSALSEPVWPPKADYQQSDTPQTPQSKATGEDLQLVPAR